MVFIRAIAMVMFPMLRRTDANKLKQLYTVMRTSIMVPLLGLLICYYPLVYIMKMWLPQYADSLKYMALLFPMCIFESKISMLIETYMKNFRKEKWILTVNLFTVFLSLISATITVYMMRNLDLAVLSIVIVLAARCVCSELLLSKYMKENLNNSIMQELMLTSAFICVSWYIGGGIGLCSYAAMYILYLFFNRKNILFTIEYIRLNKIKS